MKRRLSVHMLVVLVFTLAGSVCAQTTVFTGTCDVNQISYTATDSVSETIVSTTFTGVPNTAFFFNVTDGLCAKIDFSASIASGSQSRLTLRLLFDENPEVVILPGEIQLNPTSEGRNFSASFILPLEDGLAAGNHNVRIQWRSQHPTTVMSSNTRVVTYHN